MRREERFEMLAGNEEPLDAVSRAGDHHVRNLTIYGQVRFGIQGDEITAKN